MENFDLSKLINHYFIDYLFASEDFKYFKIKEGPYLNHDTIAYKELTNELLILQPSEGLGDFHFYLWTINLNFILEVPKPNQSQEDHLKYLKKEYFKKIRLSFFSLQKKEIVLKKDGAYSQFPLEFKLNSNGNIIAFSTINQIFIAALDKIEIKDAKNVLRANEIKLENPNSSLDVLKWHPEVPTCLGVLFDNKFYIYDVTESLDTYDFHLSLSSRKKGKNAITFPDTKGDEQLTFIDFTFCTQDNLEDFRYLSVFFLSNSGDIFYYSPIFIPKLKIPEADFQYKSKAIVNNLGEDSKRFYERLFECIELNSQLKDGYYILKSVKHTPFETLSTENSIQGYNFPLFRSYN